MAKLEVPDVKLDVFIKFLVDHEYEIAKKNPRHVPGEGYSPSEYYRNVNIEYALEHFKEFLDKQPK
jgi:hypothetical protein